MAEYIERDKLIKDGWQLQRYVYGENYAYAESMNIRDVPAADVRPVVRGTWVGIDDFPHDDWECDHCGCVVESTNDPWNYYHFCPNCGAMMEES